MERQKIILLGLLFCFLVILVIIFFKTSSQEQIKKSSEIPQPKPQAKAPEPKATKKVTLFFPREDNDLLWPEVREILADASLIREAEQVIAELIKGSKRGFLSALPVETKLWQLFLTRDGTAYVDFSREIMEKHPSGSSAEILTIYAIVDSLTFNFKTIKKVVILIDGEEKETFAGHISLEKPFLPDYSLIGKRQQVDF